MKKRENFFGLHCDIMSATSELIDRESGAMFAVLADETFIGYVVAESIDSALDVAEQACPSARYVEAQGPNSADLPRSRLLRTENG